MNDLYEMKKEILTRKANTPKDDKETLKNINLEYMLIISSNIIDNIIRTRNINIQ